MMEDKLDRLIELNERIVNQNDAIIDLLKKLTGKDEEIIEENEDELIFESKLNSGEVLFVANSPDNQIDIYKLTVKKSDELKVSPPEIIDEIEYDFDDNNYEITLDNLTGNSLTNQFNVPLAISIESLEKDASIPSEVCILDDETFNNLPEMLKVAMTNGADKIHLAMKNAMVVAHAPPELLNHLEFYRNSNEIFEKLL